MKIFLSVFFLMIFSVSIHSQSKEINKKTLEAVKINSEEINLDGKLDELFWNDISGIDDFLMREPIEGGEPTENTIIKIAFDEKYLYIGAVLYDSEPCLLYTSDAADE